MKQLTIFSSHTEHIKCPECGKVQSAKVLHTEAWNSYVHHCESCKYVIMESEWHKVELLPRFSIPAKDILAFIFSQRERLEALYSETEQLDRLKTNTRSPFHC